MFSSDLPTYADIISGPLTILGSTEFKALDNFLAIKVLPVPGGPYSKTPLTWEIPYFLSTYYRYLIMYK